MVVAKVLNGGIETIFLIYVKTNKAQITRLCKVETTKADIP